MHQQVSLRRLASLCLPLVTVGFLGCGSGDDGGPMMTGDMGVGGNAGAGATTSGTAGNVATAGSNGTGGSSAGSAGNTTGSGGSAGGQNESDASTPDAASPKDGGGPVATDAGLAASTNTARPLGMTDAKNGFWEYLPKGYGNGIPSPLLVFWHGIGENGAGDAAALNIVQANGPPKLIKANQWAATRPFVVLSPQHAGGGCPSATEIHDFMTFAIGKYAVDPKRVYLTGLSCGALGSASYLAQFGSEQVAAAVLISGDATPIYSSKMCGFLTKTALWAFHGDADPTVSIAGDNATMPKFIACPKPPKTDAQYTVYPMVGHDAWSRTYDLSAGHDIYAWMLGFTH